MSIIEKLIEKDIPCKFQGIIDIIGKDKFLELLDKEGGKKIYLPQKENFELHVISRLVYEEHLNGSTVTELSDKNNSQVHQEASYRGGLKVSLFSYTGK